MINVRMIEHGAVQNQLRRTGKLRLPTREKADAECA
jgi:hypothetical protein